MRKLITVLVLLAVLTANAQTKNAEQQSSLFTSSPLDDSTLHVSSLFHFQKGGWRFICSYGGNESYIQLTEDDHLKMVGDTVAVMKMICRSTEENMKEFRELQERNDAAEEILRYVTTDGKIDNMKKFKAAVVKYQKLKNPKK